MAPPSFVLTQERPVLRVFEVEIAAFDYATFMDGLALEPIILTACHDDLLSREDIPQACIRLNLHTFLF